MNTNRVQLQPSDKPDDFTQSHPIYKLLASHFTQPSIASTILKSVELIQLAMGSKRSKVARGSKTSNFVDRISNLHYTIDWLLQPYFQNFIKKHCY